MDPKVCIETEDLEVLAEDLERALAPADDAERARTPRDGWTDGFRASGVKHALM